MTIATLYSCGICLLTHHELILVLILHTTLCTASWRAYDSIEGIEVAWNVVKLSRIPKTERKRIKIEIKLLKGLEHPNVIKYHNSWVNREREEIIFVTEIMSSGSLKE